MQTTNKSLTLLDGLNKPYNFYEFNVGIIEEKQGVRVSIVRTKSDGSIEGTSVDLNPVQVKELVSYLRAYL